MTANTEGVATIIGSDRVVRSRVDAERFMS